ncbi:hypothetical protein ACPA9J_10625 [Pseudomonas aeruginosa]
MIVYNLLESIRLLADGRRNFNKHCVAGLEPDAQRAWPTCWSAA